MDQNYLLFFYGVFLSIFFQIYVSLCDLETKVRYIGKRALLDRGIFRTALLRNVDLQHCGTIGSFTTEAIRSKKALKLVVVFQHMINNRERYDGGERGNVNCRILSWTVDGLRYVPQSGKRE